MARKKTIYPRYAKALQVGDIIRYARRYFRITHVNPVQELGRIDFRLEATGGEPFNAFLDKHQILDVIKGDN